MIRVEMKKIIVTRLFLLMSAFFPMTLVTSSNIREKMHFRSQILNSAFLEDPDGHTHFKAII